MVAWHTSPTVVYVRSNNIHNIFPLPFYLERLMERSLKTFLRRLSVRSELPDLLFCFDDYVARGALAAIAHLGIRMPVDMKFATLVNKGNAPVSAIGLARLVNDPRAIGQWTADALLSRIDKRSVPPLPRVSFENGESFSLKCGVSNWRGDPECVDQKSR